ncbi:MAG: hypothetical protein U9Q07_07990 [Planctomycetota bacterium]|nr:hypothetical protein [Planctomycetota bacterium]
MTEGVLALHIDTLDKMAPFFLAAHALIFVLLIICLFLASRYFLHANREQKLIRLDMGKLAEEVHLLRRELKHDKDSDSAVQ